MSQANGHVLGVVLAKVMKTNLRQNFHKYLCGKQRKASRGIKLIMLCFTYSLYVCSGSISCLCETCVLMETPTLVSTCICWLYNNPSLDIPIFENVLQKIVDILTVTKFLV